MTLSRCCLIGLFAFASGCATHASDRVVRVPVRPAAGVDAGITDADACTRAGGWWTVVGRGMKEACIIPAKDGGKACADDSECEAFCAAALGATAGSPVSGTCTSGAVAPCDAMHVRKGRAVVSCVE